MTWFLYSKIKLCMTPAVKVIAVRLKMTRNGDRKNKMFTHELSDPTPPSSGSE
jgi:hypothetical protein